MWLRKTRFWGEKVADVVDAHNSRPPYIQQSTRNATRPHRNLQDSSEQPTTADFSNAVASEPELHAADNRGEQDGR